MRKMSIFDKYIVFVEREERINKKKKTAYLMRFFNGN